jgi:hypothetical protein
MAKTATKKKRARPAALPPLQGIEQRVMAYVSSSVAFENYGDCCSVEDMAARFRRTPGRFLTLLRKLEAKGYVTIRGETLPWVYPTVAALRHQDETLSETRAKRILRRIGGTK